MEKTDVKLEAEVSEIKISLPKTVGARIKIDSGTSSRELNGDLSHFQPQIEETASAFF